VLPVALAVALGVAALQPAAAGPPPPSIRLFAAADDGGDSVTHVHIQNTAFNPEVVTILVGEAVEWHNHDAVPHTATADLGLFDSGTLNNGDTFQFTFSEVGVITYHCLIHSGQTGTVVVVNPDALPDLIISELADAGGVPGLTADIEVTVRNIGGDFFHPAYPPLSFIYPQGWTPETVSGPQVLGVNLIRNDRQAAWRWVAAGVNSFVQVRQVSEEMKNQPLIIADGHHRYEATLSYRDRMRSQRGQWTGREPFNYIMTYFANMNDENLVILPTHRLVRGYAPQPFLQLEEKLQKYFYIEPYPKTPEGQKWFLKALRSGGKKQRLIGASFKRDPRYLILRLRNKRIMQRLAKEVSAALRELDVSTLHVLILGHILGLSPEQQVSGETVYYSQDEEALLQALEKEDYQAAFILNPPKREEVLAIVAGGEKMPQKSTYFYPKLVSGLIINKIDPTEEIEAMV
jgi:plastocyanin